MAARPLRFEPDARRSVEDLPSPRPSWRLVSVRQRALLAATRDLLASRRALAYF